MDKYEYNLKLEEIDKQVARKDYQEAARLADTIDWRRVRNVRTLCLISEIYEAAGRPEDAKTLLVRAYKRSPVGRTVLYRLIEVTTKLGQYDEAIEYYSEYVQLAPHDNNRYILKYQIYRGRGSQIEELIAILEEYLGQEYTERWAYELATLYQQAGQIQKCLAACDDLVLWFHSGKYVTKALELKKRYAALTPKQQQIYEEGQQAAEDDYLDEPEDAGETVIQNAPGGDEPVIQKVERTDGEVLAESIMAETEKEIADQVTAHKAELDKGADQTSGSPQEALGAPDGEKASKAAADGTEVSGAAQTEDPEDLQAEIAKSMRKIISGVVKREEPHEDDIPASVEPRIQNTPKIQLPEQTEQVAGQLSIDDILLSMSDQGRRVADAVISDAENKEAEEEPVPAFEQPEVLEAEEFSEARGARVKVRTVTEAAASELTDDQREALQYTSHPERLLKNKRSLPTYTQEDDDLGKTRRIVNTKEELLEAAKQEILQEKTIRIPTEEISRKLEEGGLQAQPEAASGTGAQTESFAGDGSGVQTGGAADSGAQPEMMRGGQFPEAENLTQETNDMAGEPQYTDIYGPDGEMEELYGADGQTDQPQGMAENPASPEVQELREEYPGDEAYYGEDEEEPLMIPQHLRGLFNGFIQVEGLEDQIANAILQAESKGTDRTSRSGNILIFGAHGSGKTTLAMNLAKAIAQDRGSQTMKIARIYAADLNRKDIAATIAKIAGGTLIIEEAGDLEPGTVEQLTTAMEFRTDGLIMILEDEQQYVHELLMQHPRFTMKFTAQIYIPAYNVEELAGFGQIYANAQDFRIGDEAYEVLKQKLSQAQEAGAVSITDVIEIVGKAINRSNKFFRKISMGKKRYDENDYVVLFPKDMGR